MKSNKRIINKNLLWNLPAFIAAIILVSCNSGKKIDPDPVTGDSATVLNTIKFTNEQIKLAEIETGSVEKRIISDYVECSGVIEAPPQNLVSVTAPMDGFLKETYFYPGNFVKAGTILAVLEHADYINLQQDYLEAQSQLEYYKEEFKRQGELTLENAASMKKMQNAQAEYKSLDAKYMALRKKLELLDINPDTLTPENISATIKIKAPISGYIAKANGNRGKYISSQDDLYQIVDKSHLHLQLKVFEKDIYRIKPGAKVMFQITGNEGYVHNAEIETIGQMIDDANRTIPIHAHIIGTSNIFIPGMYINARIILRDSPVYSLPVTSLVKTNDKTCIFLSSNNKFTRVPVNIGIEQDSLVEVINPSSSILSSKIVTKGAYYIETELGKMND